MSGKTSKVYEMAFRLNAMLDNKYGTAFTQAEAIADRAVSNITQKVLQLGSAVLSARALKDVVDTWTEYEKAAGNTASIMNLDRTSAAWKEIDEIARQAGATTQKTAIEAQEALGYMALAGWDAQDAIKGLTPMLNLSVATDTDLGEVSDLMIGSMAAMGVGVGDIEHYTDVLAAANNNSKQTAIDVMEAFTTVGSAFKTFGVGYEEGAALFGVMANRGNVGSTAGTAIKSLLSNISKESGSSEALKMMEKYNLSAYDDEGNFKGLYNTMVEINDAMNGMTTDAEKNAFLMAVGGKRMYSQLAGVFDALNNVDENGLNEWQRLQQILEGSEGSLQNMVDIRTDDLVSDLEILNSVWTEEKLKIGESFSDKMRDWVQHLIEILPQLTPKFETVLELLAYWVEKIWSAGEALFNFLDEHPNILTSFIGGLVGLNAGSKILNLVNGIQKLFKAFELVEGGATLTKAASGLGGFSTAILTLATQPHIALVLGIAAAIGAVGVSVWNANRKMREAAIEEAFGDIELSAEDCARAVEAWAKATDNWTATNITGELEKLNNYLEEVEKHKETLDLLNWKINAGIELKDSEKEEYQNSVQGLVDSSTNVVDQGAYAIHEAMENVGIDQELIDQFMEIYTADRAEVVSIGEQIGEILAEATENGYTPDLVSKLKAAQDEMNAYVEKYALAEQQAKWDMLNFEYGNGQQLTADSAAGMIKAFDDYYQGYYDERYNNYSTLMQGIRADDNLSESEKQAQESALWQQFQSEMDSLQAQIAQQEINNLMPVIQSLTNKGLYGDSLQKALNESLGEDIASQFINLLDSANLDVTGLNNYITRIADNYISEDDVPQSIKDHLFNTFGNEIIASVLNGNPQGMVAWDLINGKNAQLAGFASSGAQPDLEAITEAEAEGKERSERQAYAERLQDSNNFNEEWVTGYVAANEGALANMNDFEVQMFYAGYNLGEAAYKGIYLWCATHNSGFFTGSGLGQTVDDQFASGTNYTPDTFIAGEAGAELITGAEGRKVYDALSTGRILSNAQRLEDIWAVMEQEISDVKEKSGVVGSNEGTSIVVNMPSITIQGNADSGTVKDIESVLAKYKQEIEKSIFEQIERNKARERRLANS